MVNGSGVSRASEMGGSAMPRGPVNFWGPSGTIMIFFFSLPS